LDESGYMTVTPISGWSYEIVATNYVERELSDGTIVTTFTIGTQQEYVSDYDFTIIGTNGISLYDSDSTLIGAFDGYMTDTKVYFEYKSTNLDDQTWVTTKIEATKRN